MCAPVIWIFPVDGSKVLLAPLDADAHDEDIMSNIFMRHPDADDNATRPYPTE